MVYTFDFLQVFCANKKVDLPIVFLLRNLFLAPNRNKEKREFTKSLFYGFIGEKQWAHRVCS
jgi:hypothetical protein